MGAMWVERHLVVVALVVVSRGESLLVVQVAAAALEGLVAELAVLVVELEAAAVLVALVVVQAAAVGLEVSRGGGPGRGSKHSHEDDDPDDDPNKRRKTDPTPKPPKKAVGKKGTKKGATGIWRAVPWTWSETRGDLSPY